MFAEDEVNDHSGGPDGASVDSDGFCAVFANRCLLRFDPDGSLERRVELPVKAPTMPAFGGDDMRILFVTSANWPLLPEERTRNSLEGGLLATQAPVPGLPPAMFGSR